MIHAAITSLNSSEKGHKIPMTSFGQLSGCQGSLTVAIPAVHSAYLLQKGCHKSPYDVAITRL